MKDAVFPVLLFNHILPHETNEMVSVGKFKVYTEPLFQDFGSIAGVGGGEGDFTIGAT
jgi:hypothetical protein